MSSANGVGVKKESNDIYPVQCYRCRSFFQESCFIFIPALICKNSPSKFTNCLFSNILSGFPSQLKVLSAWRFSVTDIAKRMMVISNETSSSRRRPDLRLAFNHLFRTPQAVDPTQIGAFLTALCINRVE